MPRVGSSKMMMSESVLQPLADNDLLLVAAGQIFCLLLERRGLDAHGVRQLLIVLGFLGLVEAERRHRGVHVRQRNVLVEREFEDKALTLAVLGQQCQTELFAPAHRI